MLYYQTFPTPLLGRVWLDHSLRVVFDVGNAFAEGGVVVRNWMDYLSGWLSGYLGMHPFFGETERFSTQFFAGRP